MLSIAQKMVRRVSRLQGQVKSSQVGLRTLQGIPIGTGFRAIDGGKSEGLQEKKRRMVSIQTQAVKFAKFCVNGIDKCESLEDFKNSKNISSFSYVGKDVEVWKLPEIEGGLMWPSFWYYEKQSMATSPHLLYVRTDATSKVRRDSVTRFLQEEGRSTVVVGSAGSGKQVV